MRFSRGGWGYRFCVTCMAASLEPAAEGADSGRGENGQKSPRPGGLTTVPLAGKCSRAAIKSASRPTLTMSNALFPSGLPPKSRRATTAFSMALRRRSWPGSTRTSIRLSSGAARTSTRGRITFSMADRSLPRPLISAAASFVTTEWTPGPSLSLCAYKRTLSASHYRPNTPRAKSDSLSVGCWESP